jgi:hypothetical protein
LSTPAADAIPGFRHTHGSSRLPLGALQSAVNDGTSTRFVGSDGTFIEWSNGFSKGSAHGGSAAISAAPLTTSSSQHTTRVLAYFKAAGIPQDQLGTPSITTQMLRTGVTNGPELSHTLVGYTTILARVVDGVPVDDSHAWARFNINDDVVAEQVWWPALPSSVHADVAAFRAMLADPNANSNFRAKLTADLAGKAGELRIHHSLPLATRSFFAVTLDFAVSNVTRSIDLNGNVPDLTSIPAGSP